MVGMLDWTGHVVMLGYGKGSSVTLKALKKAGLDVVIVNDDPVVVRQLIQEEGVQAVHGDGSDPQVLELVGARRARLIISSMRRTADAESVLRHLGPDGPTLIIRVFETVSAERIRALGGVPVLSSEAAADAFQGWYQRMFGDSKPVELETAGEPA